MTDIWARKSTDDLTREAAATGEGKSGPLRRTLTALNLIALGVGGIIGAGIFVLTGHAAAANGRPGRDPVLGEFVAWIIGWDLILEYAWAPSRWRSAGPAMSSAFCVTSASMCRRGLHKGARNLRGGAVGCAHLNHLDVRAADRYLAAARGVARHWLS